VPTISRLSFYHTWLSRENTAAARKAHETSPTADARHHPRKQKNALKVLATASLFRPFQTEAEIKQRPNRSNKGSNDYDASCRGCMNATTTGDTKSDTKNWKDWKAPAIDVR